LTAKTLILFRNLQTAGCRGIWQAYYRPLSTIFATTFLFRRNGYLCAPKAARFF